MRREHWPRYAAAAAGFAWFLQNGGWHTLDPRNVAWVMAGDWLQHWLGWLFYRGAPLSFPLGRIPGLLYPVGSNIGFTDSNPLVSILLKPFSPLLPPYVQFIGPWLALCFVLQGYMGAVLSATVTDRRWPQFFGGSLFALSPVLVARVGHDTLCAHWLILGLLSLGLRECRDAASAKRFAWLAAAASVLPSAIHPYLAVICWGLAQAVFVRLWRTGHLSLARAAATSAGATTAVVAVFGTIGYFGSAQMGGANFGAYSSNLLALVNPMTYSRLLPAIAIPERQWEGFGFLGLGGLALAAIAAAAWLRRPIFSTGRHAWPVLVVAGAMAVYAVSTVVVIGNRTVLDLDWLTPAATPFRASGRFIWPLHYLLLLAGVWGAARVAGRGREAWATGLLAVAVVAQAADLRMDAYWLSAKNFKPAPIYNVRLAIGKFRHVAMVPAQVFNTCGGDYREDHVYRFMYLAYRLDATYNSGIFARLPASAVMTECRRLEAQVEQGRLDPDTLYVVRSDFVQHFDPSRAACGQFGEDWICASRASDASFQRYLEENGKPALVR